MRNATHELVGASLALVAAQALEAGPLESAGLAAAALWGSRLPDLDQLGSRVHRRSLLERRSFLFGAAGAALRLPMHAFAALVPHRAVTHSALACAVTGGLAALLAYPAGAGPAPPFPHFSRVISPPTLRRVRRLGSRGLRARV